MEPFQRWAAAECSGRALRMRSRPGSTLDGTAYHSLACSSSAAGAVPKNTLIIHTDYALQVDTDTSAPAGLLWPRAAVLGRGTEQQPQCRDTTSLAHPRAASTLCTHAAVTGDEHCSAHQSPVGTSAPEKSSLIPAFGTNIQGEALL